MGGNGHRVISDTMPVLAWRDWGNPWQVSVRTAGLRPEIWTKDLPNANTLTAILGGKWSWMISMCRYGYKWRRPWSTSRYLDKQWSPDVKTLSHNSRYQAGIRKLSLEYKHRGSLIYSFTVDNVRLQITEITYCLFQYLLRSTTASRWPRIPAFQ